MAPYYSMLFKAAVAAATALQATAAPLRVAPALRASALETGVKQIPQLENALGRLPDLAPIGGPGGLPSISDAINKMPAATAFFRGEQAAGLVTDLRAWQSPVAPAPAPVSMLSPLAATLSAASPGAAGMPLAIPGGMAPDPDQFFHRVSNLLTCKELELLVGKTCGSTPLFQAIHQFENDPLICDKALVKVLELKMLFAEYFGPGANCNSFLDGWKFNGYGNKGKCEQTVRTDHFKTECRLVL